MTTSRYLILSDLHITVPSNWAAFRDHVELGSCLEHLAGEPPLTVIFAGDTFDFLMLNGYEGFDAAKSAERMAAILDHPVNVPVLKGVRAIAAGGHRLILLAGNHDPEVLQREVREVFAMRVGMTIENLGGDELLHEPSDGRPSVFGHRIDAGGETAFVVHGDRWDISNFIDRKEVLRAIKAGQPIHLPAGSRLVYRIIRKLKERGHRWVDQVKPELESVIPLLLYLDWPLTWSVLKEEYSLTANLLCGRLRSVAGVANLGSSDAGKRGPQVPPDLLPFVEALRAAMPEPERDALLSTLAGSETLVPPRPRTGEPTLASHSGFWRWLLRAWLQRVQKSKHFFTEDAEDEITMQASPSLPPGLTLLVAGHTHGRRNRSVPGFPRYLNSGTWTPVGPLPEGDIDAVIDLLEKGELPEAESPRVLVEILVSQSLEASLKAWSNGKIV